MTKLSGWARQHPVNARIIIAALHVILIALAAYTGTTFIQLGLKLQVFFFYAGVFLFLVSVFIYPFRGQQYYNVNKKQLYIIRKSCDFILGTCSFMLVCFVANRYAAKTGTLTEFAAVASSGTELKEKTTAATILSSLSYRDKSTLTKSEKKILRREFRSQLKAYTKAKLQKDEEQSARIALIILSIIGAVGLTFLLAGLACSIACGGAEALAVLVFIAGLTGIIALLVFVLKKIKHHYQGPPEKKIVPPNEN